MQRRLIALRWSLLTIIVMSAAALFASQCGRRRSNSPLGDMSEQNARRADGGNGVGSRPSPRTTIPRIGTISKEEEVTPSDEAACTFECGVPCEPSSDNKPPVCPSRCRSNDDCDEGRLCAPVTHESATSFRCVVSICGSDADCGKDERCAITSTPDVVVGRCERIGTRPLGDRCRLDGDPDNDCDRDGVCRRGICTPKTCADDATCPAGTRCLPLVSGERTCIPSCEDDVGCPDGEHCIHAGIVSFCGKADASSCTVAGCPDGQFCHLDDGSRWQVLAHCVAACDPVAQQPCGDGEVCVAVGSTLEADHGFRCEKNCALVGNECGAGYHCLIENASEGWCQPSLADRLPPS